MYFYPEHFMTCLSTEEEKERIRKKLFKKRVSTMIYAAFDLRFIGLNILFKFTKDPSFKSKSDY
jgi:hypothetical protein